MPEADLNFLRLLATDPLKPGESIVPPDQQIRPPGRTIDLAAAVREFVEQERAKKDQQNR